MLKKPTQNPAAAAKRFPVEPATRRISLAQSVAQQLLDLIRERALAPGDKLPSEMEMKEAFGVGRSTVREAINGLVTLGVVEVRHGHGAFVLGDPRPSPDALGKAIQLAETRELLEARAAMEVMIAQYAAERSEEDDLDAIEACLADAQQDIEHGGGAVEEAARFHLLLAEATQNEIAVQFIRMILGMLEDRGVVLSQTEGYSRWELAAHRNVFEAVKSGDSERARRAMARHIRDMQAIHLEGWDAFRLR